MLWCAPSWLLIVTLGFLGDSGRLGLDVAPFALRIDEATPLAGWPGRVVLLGRVVAGSAAVGRVVTVQCGDDEFYATLDGVETISPASDQRGPRTALIVRGLRRGLPACGDWVHDGHDGVLAAAEESNAVLVHHERETLNGITRRPRSSMRDDSRQTAIQRKTVELIKAPGESGL